ncbi:MAG: DNRLRE domain-containing protein [Fimbriimonadaceae bacterium]
MITALALFAAAQTVNLHPTDDIWVYGFAADQASDPFLRCWGSDGKAVGDENIGDAGSWSVMKFDISKLPASKLTSAELTLYFVPNPNIDEELGKKFPIQIRSVTPNFSENSFKFENASTIRPKSGKESIIATSPVAMYANASGPTKITIKLGSEDSKFMAALQDARKTSNKELAFALTSALTPDEAGESLIYKCYSTNSEEATKPTLTLNFE